MNSNLIQNLPQGLLSLLQIKDPDYPKQLSGVVAGILELSGFYRLAARETVADTIAAPVLGGNNFSGNLIVPNNEAWWVEHFVVSGSTGGASTISFQPGCLFQNFAVATGDLVALAISSHGRSISKVGPFLAGPGSIFQAFVGNTTGAATPLTGVCVFSRLRT